MDSSTLEFVLFRLDLTNINHQLFFPQVITSNIASFFNKNYTLFIFCVVRLTIYSFFFLFFSQCLIHDCILPSVK